MDKQKGFILLGMMFMMILIAAAAIGMNRRAGMQAKMAANQIHAVQTNFGRLAAIEHAAWQLINNPSWRTDPAGEDYVYNGITYTRKVLDSSIEGYTDAITITVTAPGGLETASTSFRVNYSQADFFLIVDTENHCIRKVDDEGVITTVAGNGTAGYSGDGGPATSAQLNNPADVFVDASGNIYIADAKNNCIRKVDSAPPHTINTIAGTGTAGYSGDGGPATLAKLNNPTDVFLDSSGKIFIADTLNNRIRKVEPAPPHTIITIVGTGIAGYSGDGGPATQAKINKPAGLFVDSSVRIFFTDSGNNRIRKVEPALPHIINTIVGTGTPGYSGDGGPATQAMVKQPVGLFVDSSGGVLIADTQNNRIRKVDGTPPHNINTIAGTGTLGYSGDGGPATQAQLTKPFGVFMDSSGWVYIADTGNERVRRVDAAGDITTVAGNGTAGYSGDGGPATSASINKSEGVFAYVPPPQKFYFIADTNNQRIRKVDTSTGIITTVAGNGSAGYSGDGGLATSANLNTPKGVAVDTSGNIYIADTLNHCIRKVDASGYISTFAGTGTKGFSGDGGAATEAQLNAPGGVAVDTSGNIYINDTTNYRIRKVDVSTGIITTVAGTGSKGYSGDGGLATSAKIHNSYGVFGDASGNINIADTDNDCIREVDASTGNISTVAGTGVGGYTGDGGAATEAQLNTPYGVFLDASGNIFIVDQKNNRIRKVDASTGNISTVAGNGTGGYSGDGGQATEANLDWPKGLCLDASGNILIADTDNHCIREVDASTGIITTVAGTPDSWGYSGDGGPAAEAKLSGAEGVWVYEESSSSSSSSLEKVTEIY